MNAFVIVYLMKECVCYPSNKLAQVLVSFIIYTVEFTIKVNLIANFYLCKIQADDLNTDLEQ